MLNYFGNNNLVPNGYVYTSHTGSKYVFLEGLWFNNSSNKMVDPRKFANMYQCAQKQIFEHNSKYKLKIGSTYLKENVEYVYIGNKQYYSKNGIISESTLKNDDSADEMYQQLKVIINDYEATNIPTGYRYKNLTKTVHGWVNENGEKVDLPIQEERAIKSDIDKRNAGDSHNSILKIGRSILNYNGNKYIWNGDVFAPFGQNAPEIPVDLQQKIKNGYKKFVSENPSLFNDAPESKNSDEQSNGETTKPADQPSSSPDTLSSSQGSSSGSAPNGFVYTSGKGKQYYKKGGEWYIGGTKNKVNASAARPLEQAAIKKIAELNSSSDLKIGESTWTSGKGVEYTYVGDDRFISSDGKLLPKSMAEKVRNELTAKKDDHKEENSEIKDKVDADIDNTSTATPEDRHEEEKAKQEQEIDNNDAKEDNQDSGVDKIKALAEKIKALPAREARKVTVLLTRADKLSLMAADIILSGDTDKVKQILQTLNNRDE